MAENKCISRICLLGFGESIKPVVEDEEDKQDLENNKNSEAK
jgi:hypothetical protein